MSQQKNLPIQRQEIPKGSFVFIEGDKDYHFYIVEKGEVEIFTMVDGKILPIAKVGPGESFGEFALLERAPRSASARATTEVHLVRVSEEGYQELLTQLPAWASSMLTSFAHRLRHMTDALKASPQFITEKK